MSEHPTTMELERLSVDDLPAARADEVRRHVAGCARCAEVAPQIAAHATAYFAAHPAGRFMDQLEAKRARRWLPRWLGWSALPAAATIALFVGLGLPRGTDVRVKGGGIDVLRREGAAFVRLGPEARISAGDELGLVLVRPHAGAVQVFVVDAAGKVDPLTPGSLALAMGEHRLPETAIVEAPCRDLRVLVVDDPALFAVSPVALGAAPRPGVTVRELRCR